MAGQSKQGRGARNSTPTQQTINKCVDELFSLFFYSLGHFTRIFVRHWMVGSIIVCWVMLLNLYFVEHGWHLELLRYIDPDFFSWDRIFSTLKYDFGTHYVLTNVATIVPAMLIIGYVFGSNSSKFDRIFSEMGLVTKSGLVPKLLWKKNLNHQRIMFEFDGRGISKNSFEQKIDLFEAQMMQEVESIQMGDNPGRVRVVTTKQRLPARIVYNQLVQTDVLKKESFYVGASTRGPIQQSIDELPHMLIAGSTGNGKSNFFKQVVRGLLESSPYIQVYAIDLKGGLEMVDFSACPNIKVIKTINQALYVLRQIKLEMESRFEFLEKNGLKSIDPSRDGKDRIIVCVDEASVLYMKRHRNDPDAGKALEARSLTDSIAKLSRAAKINLILATQKLTAEVLPTSITENISGRMCFRTESLPGSLLVLNTRDAADLPEVKGRGIWSYGSRPFVVQSPMLSDDEIRIFSKQIAEDFKNGTRHCLSAMVGKAHKTNVDSKKQILDGEIGRKADCYERMNQKESGRV